MNYDIIIIGSGPGGYVAAIRASQLKLKTAIVEKEHLGGICLNWGCIPTKSLLKSAEVMNYFQHAKSYGIDVKDFGADFKEVIKRSRSVADGMSKGVEYLMKKNKIDVIKGRGKIKAVGEVTVEDASGKQNAYKTKHIVIATGARSRSIGAIPQDGKNIIGYREAMSLEKRPKSVVVIGSGAIGIEFAYFYHKMGTKVTIVEMLPNVVPLEDEEISKHLEKTFKKEGIDIFTNTGVDKVEVKNSGGCTVHLTTSKGKEKIDCDVALSAIGIQPNIENIGLEQLGVKTEKGRIVVDNFYATNITGIYAIGDVLNTQALAHVASDEGRICVEKIAGHNPHPLDYNNIPACTYAAPEIASVGYTEKQAKEAGYNVKVGKFPFSALGKAHAIGAKEGFAKVVFDAKYGEFLGAHLIGANVTEMIAEVVVARQLETTATEIIQSVHPHPTISESIMEATALAFDEPINI